MIHRSKDLEITMEKKAPLRPRYGQIQVPNLSLFLQKHCGFTFKSVSLTPARLLSVARHRGDQQERENDSLPFIIPIGKMSIPRYGS